MERFLNSQVYHLSVFMPNDHFFPPLCISNWKYWKKQLAEHNYTCWNSVDTETNILTFFDKSQWIFNGHKWPGSSFYISLKQNMSNCSIPKIMLGPGFSADWEGCVSCESSLTCPEAGESFLKLFHPNIHQLWPYLAFEVTTWNGVL